MSWFKFGDKVDPGKIIDDFTDKDKGHLKNIGEWMDNQNFSEEERAKFKMGAIEQLLRFMAASEPFRKAQRAIAEIVAVVWALSAVVGLLCVMIDIAAVLMSKDSFAVGILLNFAMSNFVWVPASLVFALYFAGGAINSWNNKEGK